MADKKKDKKPSELSEAAAKLGRAGGLVGGKARAASLSAEERKRIAAAGGRARASKIKATKKKITRKKKDS